MNKFYVYLHIDPITNNITYVGKGKGKRAYCLEKRNEKHSRWISDLKARNLIPKIEIIEYFNNEEEAFKKEIELIKKYKDIEPLTNMHCGGTGFAGKNNGAYGLKRPDLSERNKKTKGKTLEEIYGMEKADKIRINLSNVTSGKNNPMYGKQSPALGRIKEKHPMYGKTQTEEAKNKISHSLKISRGKPIIRSDGKTYICLIDAAKELGLKDQKEITKVLKGIRKDINGYTFQYVNKKYPNLEQS